LDLAPVVQEIVGVTPEEFMSGELSAETFERDTRLMQAVRLKEYFQLEEKG